MLEKLKNKGLPQYAVAALFWILVWVVVAKKINLDLIFPSIPSVWASLKELLKDSHFYASCLSSVRHILTGWLMGSILGVIIGTLSFFSKWINALFAPVLHIIKATPVASFIIVMLVLMHNAKDYVPAVIAAMIVLPVVCGNTRAGLESPDEKLLEMARAFNMKKGRQAKDIYLPVLKNHLLSSATTSMGLAWKAGIAAEVICTPVKTIGAAIYETKVYLDTPSLFAWTAAVIVLSVLFEGLIRLIVYLCSGRKGKTKNES